MISCEQKSNGKAARQQHVSFGHLPMEVYQQSASDQLWHMPNTGSSITGLLCSSLPSASFSVFATGSGFTSVSLTVPSAARLAMACAETGLQAVLYSILSLCRVCVGAKRKSGLAAENKGLHAQLYFLLSMVVVQSQCVFAFGLPGDARRKWPF